MLMARTLMTTLAILLSCGPIHAQSAMSTFLNRTTSPLGTLGSESSNRLVGANIPLGATEIDRGGLSPAVSANCSSIGSSSSVMTGAPGAISTFDGGGTTTTGSSTLGACTPGSLSATGNVFSLSNSGATIGSSLTAGSIPLGATELAGAGTAPIISVPLPNSTSNPCIGSSALGISPGVTTDGASSPTC